PDIVKHVWLEPGADFKEVILNGEQQTFGFELTVPKRLPIGEKGVGRFGVHKLGDYIKMISKSPDSDKEVVVEINWAEFLNKRYLDEAVFDVSERKPEFFIKGQSGTHISVKKLRKAWDKPSYRELQRSLLSLNTPFQKKSDFSIKPSLSLKDKNLEKDWGKDLLDVKQIKQKALWKLDCTLSGNKIIDFKFEFNPWPEMDKLEPRKLTINDIDIRLRKIKYKEGRKEIPIDLSKHRIGPVRIQAYLFDLGTKLLKLGFQDPKILKEFLAENGGVRVYRDGLRVFNYGEVENDWLNLDKTRINEPVKKIGNRNILAAVQLLRKESRDLIEKTNREGFVENIAYKDFQKATSSIIDLFAQQRNIDKIKIREYYGGSSKTQPVLHDIDKLKVLIEDKLKDIDFKDKDKFTTNVFSSLDRIKKQYIKSNRILLKSAGAGLSLSVVIHEIEKRLKELIGIVDEDVLDAQRVKILVHSITRLVDNYAVLVAEEKTKNVNIKKIIEDAIFNSEFRFKAHKVEIIRNFEKSSESKVDCS
ncbi:hypothetical protein LCGC14_2412580, partial [marine sediment metagenome]